MYQKIDGELYEEKESLASTVIASLLFLAIVAGIIGWAVLVS